MPLPRKLTVFNKHVANPVTGLVAGWAPGFGIIHHVGRRTGHEYRTPVNVFRRHGGFLIALTYGGGSWVENVLAAEGCTLVTRGQRFELRDPERYTDPDRQGVPTPVRWILGLLDVDEFLSLAIVD